MTVAEAQERLIDAALMVLNHERAVANGYTHTQEFARIELNYRAQALAVALEQERRR